MPQKKHWSTSDLINSWGNIALIKEKVPDLRLRLLCTSLVSGDAGSPLPEVIPCAAGCQLLHLKKRKLSQTNTKTKCQICWKLILWRNKLTLITRPRGQSLTCESIEWKIGPTWTWLHKVTHLKTFSDQSRVVLPFIVFLRGYCRSYKTASSSLRNHEVVKRVLRGGQEMGSDGLSQSTGHKWTFDCGT